MPYNPSLYNPYGSQQFQPTISYPQQTVPTMQARMQQPVNGLVILEGGMSAVDSYSMPPGSVSPPLFIDENHFAIKSFDTSGGSTTELYEAKKIPLSSLLDPRDVNVTKADLDSFKAEIMEAINAQHSVPEISEPEDSDANTAG